MNLSLTSRSLWIVSWNPPSNGFIEMNSDAAMLDGSIVELDVVFRDDLGRVMASDVNYQK